MAVPWLMKNASSGKSKRSGSLGALADGYFQATCMVSVSSSSLLFPRSAMSSRDPKYGEPAPGAPAVPKALFGRSICTAATRAPCDSPPTIQACEPLTATAA